MPTLRKPDPETLSVAQVDNRSPLCYYAIEYFPQIDEAYGGQEESQRGSQKPKRLKLC